MNILMTWYGITDLKASMGLEEGVGPILAALQSEDYDKVVILGYTDNTKADKGTSSDVFKIANTDTAHSTFISWLRKNIESQSKQTQIFFRPVYLNSLNDTEGIYDAANKELDVVVTSDSSSTVTFYVSPGTPVMAYVWAFVALRYPNLKKRLIASSTGGKPETVTLPDEWMEWHGRQINTHKNTDCKFDVVFHLFGEQRMPSLLGIKQFESKKHAFLNSPKYPATVMKQFLDGAEFKEISVDPFSPEDTRVKALEEIQSMPDNPRIGFNLTGGTKLMYAGALSACKKVNGTPFYFNGPGNKLIFLNDFETADTKKIDSVETFIKLNGDGLKIANPGNWKNISGIETEERTKLTQLLWTNRNKIASLYKKMVRDSENNSPFKASNGTIMINFDHRYNASVQIDSMSFEFKNWKDFGKYITGGWFEEFTYMQLKPLQDAGVIKDLRIGMELSIDQKNTSSVTSFESLKTMFGEMYQELDIVFTDGQKLFIVECKAGKIKSDHIMKLQNIVRYFGGIESKGIVAGCFPPDSGAVRKKIDDSTNIMLTAGKDFSEKLQSEVKKLIKGNSAESASKEIVKEVQTSGGMRIKKKIK